MHTASLKELKDELLQLKPAELVEICVRLTKLKQENKELLTYLLFHAGDESGFIATCKDEMDGLFTEINTSHLYFAKKSLRKISRILSKYIRFAGSKTVEAELRLHFCVLIQQLPMPWDQNPVIRNLFQTQLQKAKTVISSLHEDLQYEYKDILQELE
jgi:hypothetical protein